ncbi:phosphatase PAP2 family protein [Actinomadura scrupuli]|uniref:phosphatase PAP2 family protein n=1 Tax=Actinomadura scrupuli TaxID=559629 RepID=UPI003D956581
MPHRVPRGAVCVPAAALVVIVTADVLAHGPLTHLDHVVHRFDAAHVQGVRATAAETLAAIGQRWVLLCLIVPLAAVAGVRTRSWRYPLVSALIVAVLSLLQTLLKSLIPRTYPVGGKDLLFEYGDAYPSGHTLNAFVLVWVALELLVVAAPALAVRLPSERRLALALTTGLVAGIGLTLADYHWLTDVLASWGIGPLLLVPLIAARPFDRPQRP